MQLAISAAMLKGADLDRTVAGLQTALNEDGNFNGQSPGLQRNLPPALQEHAQASQALLSLIQRTVEAPGSAAPSREIALAARRTRESGFRLWQSTIAELDGLLEKRIDALAGMRLWALALTSLALAASFGIAARVLRAAIRLLARMAQDLWSQSERIAAASQQILISSQSLSSGATEQAASLQQTSASSLEINSIASMNSKSARSAAELVTDSHLQFDKANRFLDEMVTAMGEISAGSNKISGVIKVIDEIAFQANILALNAAVEAARAGESGMGFAVVANEVRNLAQRSAQAAKETASLIEGSISSARHGQEKVGQVALAIRTITDESERLKDLVDEVNRNSHSQSHALEQVTQALTRIEEVTQSNAICAEKSSSYVEEFNAQSAKLQTIVRQIALLVGEQSRGTDSALELIEAGCQTPADRLGNQRLQR